MSNQFARPVGPDGLSAAFSIQLLHRPIDDVRLKKDRFPANMPLKKERHGGVFDPVPLAAAARVRSCLATVTGDWFQHQI